MNIANDVLNVKFVRSGYCVKGYKSAFFLSGVSEFKYTKVIIFLSLYNLKININRYRSEVKMRNNIIICGILMIVIGAILVGTGINLAADGGDVRGTLTGVGLENIGEYVTAGGIIACCLGIFLPSQPPPPQIYPCITCGHMLKYRNEFQKWYCDNCKKYV